MELLNIGNIFFTSLFWFLVAMVLVFHSHFVMGVEWSVAREFLVLGMYFAWMTTWDYLWFVLNPYYGVRRFKKENIWWHSKSHWLFNITPLDYLFCWGISILFGVAAFLVTDSTEVFLRHILFLGWFLIFTVLTILLIAPLYKRWHAQMRRRDDRPSSGIFHAE